MAHTRTALGQCIFFPILLFFLLILPIAVFSQNFNSQGNPAELAAALVNRMSDEDALAQTFMFGWNGTTPSPLIMEWIRERHIGGIKVFGWNVQNLETLAETIGAMQRASLSGPYGIPLLTATDQEGGMVRHIKDKTSDTPGNMAIGASGFPEDAYKTGYYIGRELAALGINMNFAPVVDLATVKDSALLGTRTFGEDPVQAGILGMAFMNGLHEAGVIATAKHYPGHGGTSLDSHGVLPRIDADEKTLWGRELVPYRMLSKSGLSAVMSGHLAFPRTPAGNESASLSPWFMQTLLREKIGFRGMVITDDLLMYGALINTGNLALTAREALMAGNDMILVSTTQALNGELWTSLLGSMKNDAAFRLRVREAAQRVLAVKLAFLRGEKAVPFIPDQNRVRTSIPDPEGAAFFLDLAARSITTVKKGTLPLNPAKKVLLIGRYSGFFQAGRRAFPEAMVYSFDSFTFDSFTFNGGEIASSLVDAAGRADTIICCIESREDMRRLESLRFLNKTIVVLNVSSINITGLIGKEIWVDTAIELYSACDQSFIAGFSFLLGRFGGSFP